MQNVMHIAPNAGHTAQNDSRTMQNVGRTHIMSGATHLMFVKDPRGGLMCPPGPHTTIHEKTLVSRNEFRNLSNHDYFLTADEAF